MHRISRGCLAAVLALLASAACMAEPAPRPEHPRPDLRRDLWLNLNGTWQFEVDNEATGEQRGLMTGHDLARTITVPFCPESKLSGVANTDFMTQVWYRRTFEVPANMQGRRLLLNFGAVDWEARVWLNGTYVGSHRGGYTPFRFDVTKQAKEGTNELVLQVKDDTRSGLQATGKQSHRLESYGCLYTRTTGIWQTVWLEAAGDTWVQGFTVTPDVQGRRAVVQAQVGGPSTGATVRVAAYDAGKVVAEETVSAAWRSTLAVLSITQPKLWEPGSPNLYDLRVTVEREGKVVDEVWGYFGMRTLRVEGNRVLINDKPVFQRLVLDQGFYPEGIYTAPSDEALRGDVELSMAAGFNGARLHQKVFEPRLLYWADRLGYLVWGEYPSWGVNLDDPAALTQVMVEWQEVLARDRNHPSIVGWCPLNETGSNVGAARAQQLLAVTQLVDPSRPFLDTSGYVHFVPETDVYDCHDYNQNPDSFRGRYSLFSLTGANAWNNRPEDPRSAYRGQPFFVSEYGGTRLQAAGEGQDKAWGYGAATTSAQEFLARYKGLTDALLDNPNMFGFCYTQLTDIEQEQNGVYFYDRRPKYDPALLKAINSRPAAYETQPPRVAELHPRVLLPTSQQKPQTWRYTMDKPEGEWMAVAYDDRAWKTGPGGFGTTTTPGAVVGTEWKTQDLWLRQEFTTADTQMTLGLLGIHHDEDADVYLNGKLIATLTGFTTDYGMVEVTEALRKALVPGRNVLTVHCHQTVGGQFIDAGLSVQ
jgi:hypothetical protein